jgi:tetratricopeptide (TPR) repeat protein
VAAPPPPPPETPHEAVVRIANAIRRADFEGDRPRLMALYEEMEPHVEGPLASRARYWRGFALWRKALNGIHDEAPETEVDGDLRVAVQEFQQSVTLDPAFVDAKIAEASCLATLAPTIPAGERPKEFRRQWDLLLELQKQAPENPRLAWVFGMAKWDTPAKQGGGQEKAVQAFKDGLGLARKQSVSDLADPAWGEAELLMSLAWSSLNAKAPNLDAAGHYAQAALNLAPDWHYVRDILVPQSEAAKDKAAQPTPTPGPKKRRAS